MRIAHERQANGTLSDAPEALKQLRRNLKGDIDRLKKLICDTSKKPEEQPHTRVMAELVPEQAALLKQAADNSQAMLDELAQWRSWSKRLNKPGNHRDAPNLALPMRQAVVRAWSDYREECTGKVRATFQGCLDTHGADEIYKSATTGKSYQLIELAPDEATLKAIVHNSQVKDSARRENAKTEKSKSRQKRTRK